MVARFLVPALALAVSPAAAAAMTCTPTDKPCFFPGHIDQTLHNLAFDQCQLFSIARGGGGYSWSSNVCITYKNYNNALGFHLLTDIVQSGRCGTQLPQVQGDFPGNDLADAPAVDAIQCNYKCEDTPGCLAYSWSNWQNGTCWMKTSRPETPVGPFDGSVISGEVFTCSVSDNRDIVGEDLTSVKRANWRECCGVCRRTAGCKASSWTDYNGGTCWLKKSNRGKSDLTTGVTALTFD